jgi:hypothetical protein
MKISQAFSTLKDLTITDFCIISLILFSGIIIFFFQINHKNDVQIIISVNNEIYHTTDFHNNKISIENYAILEIQDNKARITNSTCKNKLCEHQGWSNSLPIVCVPNKIIVSFNKKKNKNALPVEYITY